MITKSNGNWARAPVSCFATASWWLSPVPVSPMTANFTDPCFIGSVRLMFCAINAGVASANAMMVSTNESDRRIISPCMPY